MAVCKGEREKCAGAALAAGPRGTTQGGGGLQTLMCSLLRALRLLISQPENTDH